MLTSIEEHCDLTPNSQLLDHLKILIKENRMLDAWNLTKGDLAKWKSGEARHIAAKLANNLGNSRLGHALQTLNAREHKDIFKYHSYYLTWLIYYKGTFASIPTISNWLESNKYTSDIEKAELLSMKALAWSALSDDTQALDLINQSIDLSPNTEWLWTSKAIILKKSDDYEGAHTAAKHAHNLRPSSVRSGIEYANSLLNLGKTDDAKTLLLDCNNTYQNAEYCGRLQAIYSEEENHEKAHWCIKEYERLSPLLDKKGKEWVAGRKADFYLLSNDLEKAKSALEATSSPFHKLALENLTRNPSNLLKRKRLDVPFIKQHNMTCAPATIASIAKYWGDSHDHLDIADAICYDGTPWYKEREWMINNGYIVREFRLTEKALISLIDREIPFTLTTSWTTGAHLQACIGYDQRTGVIIMRDPTYNHYTESILEKLIEEHPVDGPRALAMIPRDRAHLIDDIELEDEDIYTQYFALSTALEKSDEKQIDEAVESLRSIDLGHPLTQKSIQRAANYYGDQKTEAEIAIKRAKDHPKIEKFAYATLYLVSREHGSQAHLEFLNERIAKKNHDPIFDAELGDAYLQDQSTWNLAYKHLRKAVYRRPSEGRSYASLSHYYSLTGDKEKASELMRVASLLSASHESYAQQYYELASEVGEINQGLEFLEQRAKQAKGSSPYPLLTLIRCYESSNHEKKAKSALIESISLYPEDGDFLTQASNLLTRWGESQKGLDLLQQAKGKMPTAEWLYQKGRYHRFLGDIDEALSAYLKSFETNPSYTNALESYAYLLADHDSQAATAFLEKAYKMHPNNHHILTMLATWHSAENPARSNELIEAIIKKTPNNTWAWRQKAINLGYLKQYDEALACAQKAYNLQSTDHYSHGILAECFENQELYEEAIKYYQSAISLDIDYTWAVRHLLSLSREQNKVSTTVKFIEEQMRSQVTDGSILSTFWQEALLLIDSDKMLALLRKAHSVRPDLWQSHSVLTEHLVHMNQLDEAMTLALKATEDFPLIARIWINLAKVKKASGNRAGEAEAYKQALQLSPSWDWAARLLAEVYEWLGEIENAIIVLTKNLESNPAYAPNAGMLADLLWKQGKQNEAYDILYEALKKDYNYNWGWSTIISWSDELSKDYTPLLQHHAQLRAEQPHWWSVASEIYEEMQNFEMAIEAISKANSLAPKNVEYWDKKAYYLTRNAQFKEAEEACAPASLNSITTPTLSIRLAWIRWQAGKHADALSLLKKVIDEHPNEIWAYQEAISWHAYLGNWQDVVKYSEILAKLTPQNSTVWLRLAQAYQNLDERRNQEKSIKALEKAHALAPENNYAVNQLFKLYLKANKIKEAEDLLPKIQHYQSDSVQALCETRLALCRGDKEKTEQSLAAMIRCKHGDSEDFSEIDDMLKLKAWKKLFKKVVEREVSAGNAGNSAAIIAWIYHQKSIYKVARKLEKLPYEDDLKLEAWSWMIDWANNLNEPSVALTLSKKHPIYHQHTHLWGRMLYLLQSGEHWKKAVEWSDDYRDRKEVQPWMMVNRTIALIASKNISEALTTADYGVHQLPPDEQTAMVETQLACLLAISGEEESAAFITENPHNADSDWGKHYTLLTQIILQSEEKQSTKPLWEEFTIEYKDWKKDELLKSLVHSARKRVRDKKHKWPSQLFFSPSGQFSGLSIFKVILTLIFIKVIIRIIINTTS